MRIIFVTDVFYPYLVGGGEVATYNVATHLASWGHEITVITGKSSQFPGDTKEKLGRLPTKEEHNGITIIRTSEPYVFGSTLSSLPSLREMYSIIKEKIKKQEVDLINPVLYRPVFPAYLGSIHSSVPCIPTVHLTSSGYKQYRGWRQYDTGALGGLSQKISEELIFHLPFQKIITVSTPLKKELSQYFKEDAIDVIYNGVNLTQYDKIKAGKKNPNQVMFIGALKTRKNVVDAIKATEIAQKSIKNIELIIVSNGGEFEKYVQEKEQATDFITYLNSPSYEEKIRILKESSIFICPSLKEGFPLVTLESLACKTPFLVYDTPEMVEMVQLTSGGVSVPYMDSNALAENIVRMLSNQKNLIKMGEYGRKQIESDFTWEHVARRQENSFQDALNPER